MSGPFPTDPRAPVFFLSYARPRSIIGAGADRGLRSQEWKSGTGRRSVTPAALEANRSVQKLFFDLTTHMNELLPLQPGQEPGFMDTSMSGGEIWEANLLRAAGTCQVFVCLLSARYLTNSEWCAMEWDVFTRRKVIRRSDEEPGEETAILPVLWVPVNAVPEVVNRVNRFSPRGLPDPYFELLYQADGMYGLLTQGALRDAYESVVWTLARQIQQIHDRYYVKPAVPPNTLGLNRSFSRRVI